jgi:vacuolar protein-sorting-associated protein 4
MWTQRAIEMVQRAIDEDNKQNYAEAYKQYQNALDYFMLAMKCTCLQKLKLLLVALSTIPDEKNDKIKVMIRGKIEEYLGRAETLKNHLTAADSKTKKAVGANGAGTSKKGCAVSLTHCVYWYS